VLRFHCAGLSVLQGCDLGLALSLYGAHWMVLIWTSLHSHSLIEKHMFEVGAISQHTSAGTARDIVVYRASRQTETMILVFAYNNNNNNNNKIIIIVCRGKQSIYTYTRPQVERQYPLNLSILPSGGKETTRESLRSGERSGKSPSSKSGCA